MVSSLGVVEYHNQLTIPMYATHFMLQIVALFLDLLNIFGLSLGLLRLLNTNPLKDLCCFPLSYVM